MLADVEAEYFAVNAGLFEAVVALSRLDHDGEFDAKKV
jgi:hypothetical protein